MNKNAFNRDERDHKLENGHCTSWDCNRNEGFMKENGGQASHSFEYTQDNKREKKINNKSPSPLQMPNSLRQKSHGVRDQLNGEQQQQWQFRNKHEDPREFNSHMKEPENNLNRAFPSPFLGWENENYGLREFDQFSHSLFSGGLDYGFRGIDGNDHVFPDNNVMRFRSSSISLGDNLEIVKIELDISDREDNEETKLELDE